MSEPDLSPMRKLKDFLAVEQAVGRTVSKIVFSPKCKDALYTDEGGGVAIHLGDDAVVVIVFGADWSGCYYAGEQPLRSGICAEDEGELAEWDVQADELELWRPSP